MRNVFGNNRHRCLQRCQLAERLRELRGTRSANTGAIDLTSLIVGVLIIGIIAAVIAAAVLAVIPWSQVNAAKQNLASVATVEDVTHANHGRYATYDSIAGSDHRDLETGDAYISRPDQRLIVETSDYGHGYVAVQKSANGDVLIRTSASPEAVQAVDAGYALAASEVIIPQYRNLTVPTSMAIPAGIDPATPQKMVTAAVTGEAYVFSATPTTAPANASGSVMMDNAGWLLIQSWTTSFSAPRMTPYGTVNDLTATVTIPTALVGTAPATLGSNRGSYNWDDTAGQWIAAAPTTSGSNTVYRFTRSGPTNNSGNYFGFTVNAPTLPDAPKGTYTATAVFSSAGTLNGDTTGSQTGTY